MRRRELCIQGLKALVGPFIGWLMAIAWCSLLAIFLDFIATSMTWFAQPLILLPLYAVPTFLFASLGLYLQYVFTRLVSFIRFVLIAPAALCAQGLAFL